MVVAVAAAAVVVDPMASCEDMVEEGASGHAEVGGILWEAFRVLGDHIPYYVVDTWAKGQRAGRHPVLLYKRFPLRRVGGLQSEGDKAVAAVRTGFQGVAHRVVRDGVGRIAD